MNLLNFSKITIAYFKENYSNIAITTIGLIFFTSVFTVMFTSSQILETDYIQKEINSTFNDNINFIVKKQITGTSESQFSTVQGDLRANAETSLEEHHIDSFIQSNGLSSSLFGDILIKNSTTGSLLDSSYRLGLGYGNLQLGILDNSLQEIINNSNQFTGRLPKDPFEVIYICKEPIFEGLYQVGERFNITTNYHTPYGKTPFQLTVVGRFDVATTTIVIDPIKEIYQYEVSDALLIDNPILHYRTFYIDKDSYNKMLHQFITDRFYNHQIEVTIEEQFTISLNKIKFSEFSESITNIEKFLSSFPFQGDFSIERYQEVPAVSPYYSLLSFESISELAPLRSELSEVRSLTIMVSIPGLIIAFYFTMFSSNIFFSKRKEQIGMLRLRGSSDNQLKGLFIVEMVMSIILSLVVGIILGVTLAFMITNKDFELSDLSMDTFSTIAFWTVIFTCLLIFQKVQSLRQLDFIKSRVTIKEHPLWYRIYLDVVIFLIGLFGLTLDYLILFNNRSVIIEVVRNEELLTLLSYFSLFFAICLLLGGLATFSRLITPITDFFAKKTWKKFGNLFSYSLSNISRQKEAIRVILLLSLTVSIIWGLFTTPSVLLTNSLRHSRYEIGSDAYLGGYWSSLDENDFQNDPNIDSYTPIAHTIIDGPFLAYTQIISSNFLNATYFSEGYGTKRATIQELVNENNTVLVDSDSLKRNNMKVGDDFDITYSGTTLKLSIIGSFDYWPRLVTPENLVSSVDYFMVISISTMEDFMAKHIIQKNALMKGYLLKLTKEANISSIRDNYDNIVFNNAFVDYEEFKSSLYLSTLNTQLGMTFLIDALIMASAVIFYGYGQMKERRKELAIERSLGMKTFQLSRMFFYESLAVIGFSCLFGIILGSFFSFSVCSILLLANITLVPPPIIYLPIAIVSGAIGLLSIICIAVSTIPAFIVRKQNISRSLR